MIPTTKIISCEQCKKTYEYIINHAGSNKRRFCEECAAKRKYECIDISNKSRVHESTGKPIGRPRKDSQDKSYGNDDCKFTWDETLECGGLL